MVTEEMLLPINVAQIKPHQYDPRRSHQNCQVDRLEARIRTVVDHLWIK